MKVDYKGYILDIEEIRDKDDNFVKYVSCCHQINHFDTWKANDLNIIIVRFKREVDNLLNNKEEKKIESEDPLLGEKNSVKINNKTFDIWVDPNTKGYYCYFASLKLTGKTVEEVKDQINKIYWAFS